MNDHEENEIREALKHTFRPVNTDLRRDLWPVFLQKIGERPARVPWYDRALIGLSVSVVLAFPQLILVFAYHL